ncbi:MAG TPA: hypothetical protein PK359_17345 [Burkholderiaceae bacterium]|jgi:hypothetical protein|nr:hypothetical protein [Burkholderiaceae bacterium]
MAADREGPEADPLVAALRAQQQALISGDVQALGDADQALAAALACVRKTGLTDPAGRKRLVEARRQLIDNAALLQRAAARNQRGLNALFEPAATYGMPGSSGLATPSRALHRA